MDTVSEIIGMMRAVAPAGKPRLDGAALRELTQSLITAKPGAVEEHARFLAIGQRGLCLPEVELADWLRGATLLVTGGTGCIGSVLMGQLAARYPGRLVSVSRGVTAAHPRLPSAEYLYADIRDRRALDRLIGEVRPDVVFHLAAQRNPALAEVEVHRTVSTNVLGTRNVLTAAVEAGVLQVVCASTGKALRPYSPDVYTASKRAGEWVASGVAASGEMLCSVLARTGSASPIYFSGYDPGYEEIPFPGLYDPATAGDVSPLLNAFEAAATGQSPCSARRRAGRWPVPPRWPVRTRMPCPRTTAGFWKPSGTAPLRPPTSRRPPACPGALPLRGPGRVPHAR